MSEVRTWACLLILLAIALAGCSVPAAEQAQSWPAGWRAESPAQAFDRENLYDLVNGQADAYFSYGFESVTVHELCDADDQCLSVQIWQVDNPSSAYGLYSSNVAGSTIDLANGGDEDPGRRLLFWQDRYMVELFAGQAMTPEALRTFGSWVSSSLPTGGDPPALLEKLPQGQLDPRPPLYFREELSLQNALWLGGENILGLDDQTEGVLGHYTLGEQSLDLLMVRYPEAAEAESALEALTAAPLDDLLLVGSSGPLLGAIFGEAPMDDARDLLAEALP